MGTVDPEDFILINATGMDRIRLWHYDHSRIHFSDFDYTTWVFLSGEKYDLENIENQVEKIRGVKTAWESRKSIYGSEKGLCLYLKPSMIDTVKQFLEKSGFRRRIKLFNSDLNPVHRFLSERSMELFRITSPEEYDPVIPAVRIFPYFSGNEIRKIQIDDTIFREISDNTLQEVYSSIKSSVFVIYSNQGSSFSRLLEMINVRGIGRILYKKTPGKAFESYGQVHFSGDRVSIKGKICISSDSFIYSEAGLPGIFEISRVSRLPPETASTVTPGTAVSALEFSKAISMGILIPGYKDDHESPKSLALLRLSDRGGITLQPMPGLYWNVTEIDFSSMYPSIIVRYNLSPETIGHGDYSVPWLGYRISSSPAGFLPLALGDLLDLRLFYKSIRGDHPQYSARDIALKWLLLTSFGYTGYKNAKFGKIEIHESITAIGRWAISIAMAEARRLGFTVIHGIVDSLWIAGDGDVDELLRRIKERTRLDIVVDSRYKWLLFPPARNGNGSVGTYFGLRKDGTFKARGIDMRREDVPKICKDFQFEAFSLFSECNNNSDVAEKSADLERLKKKYMNRIRSGCAHEDLAINFRITRRSEEYVVNTITRKLLKALERRGFHINPGESIVARIVNADLGIFAFDSSAEGYDRSVYIGMLKRSFKPFDYMISAAGSNHSGGHSGKNGLNLLRKNGDRDIVDLYDF